MGTRIRKILFTFLIEFKSTHLTYIENSWNIYDNHIKKHINTLEYIKLLNIGYSKQFYVQPLQRIKTFTTCQHRKRKDKSNDPII